MSIARFNDGNVEEVRDLALSDIPDHKRYLWRTIVDLPPVIDRRIESVEPAGWQVGATDAVRVYVVSRRPRDEQLRAVKFECQRRIIAATGAADIIGCLIKQHNGVSAEVQAEIIRLRNKSNEIEGLDPLPADWDSDARWNA